MRRRPPTSQTVSQSFKTLQPSTECPLKSNCSSPPYRPLDRMAKSSSSLSPSLPREEILSHFAYRYFQ